MRNAGMWVTLVLLVVVCAGAGYGAYTLAGLSWDAVVEYASPYAAEPLPDGGAQSSLATRTVLVIIDGLRLDASRQMGSLNSLRGYGADLVLTAPQPSLSYPNWTTLLSGAPPYVSGVVTNWHEGPSPVETLFDVAAMSDTRTVFVGPEDFEQLYGVSSKTDANFMREWDKEYLSDQYVDAALRLAESENPALLVVHLPDIDEAGHAEGGASDAYAQTVARVDVDLGRLITGLQDGDTVFVIVADHGHIDTGGHGGWEPEVTQVPGVFAGPGIPLGEGTGLSEDVAPTVAALAGVPALRSASGWVLESVVNTPTASAHDARVRFAQSYERIVAGQLATGAQPLGDDASRSDVQAATKAAEDARMSADRMARLWEGAPYVVIALVALAAMAIVSWRALVACAAGAGAYYLLYNVLFFGLHGYHWSLSAFNSEDLIEQWMNLRLVEAALSIVIAGVVAGAVYPLLRHTPRGPRGRYLAGWLALGPATALVVLATLSIQVGWFIWWWGIEPVWRLPDLMWAFKYDLDLIQATAVGFTAVVLPLVTFLVGRYHPKVRVRNAEE